MASVLLRAIETTSTRERPVSLACQFQAVATFDDVLLTTEAVRQTRSADAIRVSMTQGERRIGAQGRVWDDGGRLVASGQSQLLCRPVPPT